MFEWAPGIPTMDYMTENEDKESNGENYERKIIEYIVEEVIEEEDTDENIPKVF